MTDSGKAVHDAFGPATLRQWAEIAAPAVFSRAMRAYSSLKLADHGPVVANTIISNVPGPSFPVYLAGARLVSFSPLGPIMDGIGLNVTVFSYLDQVGFGFMADGELMPDVHLLAEALRTATADLLADVGTKDAIAKTAS